MRNIDYVIYGGLGYAVSIQAEAGVFRSSLLVTMLLIPIAGPSRVVGHWNNVCKICEYQAVEK